MKAVKSEMRAACCLLWVTITQVPAARWWALGLALVPVAIIALLAATPLRPDLIVVIGLAIFGAAFAVNSSLHSYLILAYAGSEKAAEDVGFYYAANAAGRFAGTLLSGLLYQMGGITACLTGSAVMLGICWLTTLLLPTQARLAEKGHPGSALPSN